MARLVTLLIAALLLCGAGETPETVSANCSGSWTNCTNALVDNTNYAETTTSGSGTSMSFTSWPFSIPQQARIRGIELLFRGYYNSFCTITKGGNIFYQFSEDGTTYTLNTTKRQITGTVAEYVVGTPSELWAITTNNYPNWSPNSFNSGGSFTVRVWGQWGVAACLPGESVYIRIEYLRVKVFYSMPDSDDYIFEQVGRLS